MDVVLAIFSGILMVVGLIGCFLPVLPGTPIAYIGLLLLQLMSKPPFSTDFLIFFLVATVAVALLDYWIPILGTKKFGGSKWGIYGSTAGLLAGIIFFPPFGIILGPLIGALIAELLAGANHKQAVKAALGSFVGFLAGTLVKVAVTCIMIYYYFIAVF